MRIVFFGTPDFAVPSLHALLTAGLDIACVVTQPDRPRGRSRSTLSASPVKDAAIDLGLPLLQPERPAGDVFLETLRRYDTDLGVVVAYGHILRQEVLDVPRQGMVNVHASLLPRLRGAAPIEWAILNGDHETGISIMRMTAGLDSGPVIRREHTPVGKTETKGELRSRLAHMGALTLVASLTEGDDLQDGEPQDDDRATLAPKINRELCRIDWTADAEACVRRIRAFDPEPGAWSLLEGETVKLFDARVSSNAVESAAPGTIVRAGDRLLLATGDGAVMVREIQPAGRRRMPVSDWVHGRASPQGQQFT